MLTQLQAENFKSWQNTGNMRLASLTGLFGTNSSGKTAIIQLLLMLKQTVESADRQRIIHTGGDKQAYVDLGTLDDIVYQHILPNEIQLSLDWNLPKPLKIKDPEGKLEILFSIDALSFSTIIEVTADSIAVKKFTYGFFSKGKKYLFGMERQGQKKYSLLQEGYQLSPSADQNRDLPPPVKTYGFPSQLNAYYQNTGFLSDIVFAFDNLFQNRIYYLGPLRDYPQRSYIWSGEEPQDVGRRGELAIPALLAARKSNKTISRGKGHPHQTIEECVATWLRELGLIHDFQLKPIAEDRKEYEVRVRCSPNAPEVLITDVGFGVSQILPVLVLCYYAKPGATIILEQPEIHLHPSAQAGLADIFIDAIKTRNVQIIVESHSEHLLRRLQRRIAEEKAGFTHQDAALYFCNTDDAGTSHKTSLELDSFGNINNWPEGFFGDEMGELLAMTEAAIKRQQNI
jgi:predicted ATPase